MTFLVGKSGSGKSTIGNLLLRFHEPSSGQILIDSTDIAELDINWLRNNITLVQQQSILFNETISRNIAFGMRDFANVSRVQIQECIDMAMLQTTMSQLPQGAETLVGSSGTALSGGERQRVALARARLRNTPILFLDESTSALDYIGRTTVMESIRKWRSGKTTVVVTHDMSLINDEDFVYVLEDGRVIQEGFRKNLLVDIKGAFAELAAHDEGPGPKLHRKNQLGDSDSRFRTNPSPRPQLSRQDSSFQKVAFDRPNSVFGSLPVSSVIRRTTRTPPIMHIPHSPRTHSPARRRSSTSLTEVAELGRYWDVTSEAPQRLPSRMSVLTGRADRAAMHLRGSRTTFHRPLTMLRTHGPLEAYQLADVDRSMLHDTGVELAESPIVDLKGLSKSKPKELSAIQVLKTVWPILDDRFRFILFTAFLAMLTNAAGPPLFSFLFSKLMTTFFNPQEMQHDALIYSLSILGIAAVDGLGCYLMHYLLECCGQKWVDTLRITAFECIIDQPKEWHDNDKNATANLETCLDRNADEMRNLLGRFAGLIMIATLIVVVALIWSVAVCWKLTLIGVAGIPGLYLTTKAFEWVTSRWERRTSDAADVVGNILVETFSDIKTVRALTLEGYFHMKYHAATARVFALGLRKSIYCGFWYGAAESTIHFVTGMLSVRHFPMLLLAEHW